MKKERKLWCSMFTNISNVSVINSCRVGRITEEELQLLGLGFNFIPKPRDVTDAEIMESFEAFARAVRTRKQFAHVEPLKNRWWVPSKTFQPEPAGPQLERYLAAVEKKLVDACNAHPAATGCRARSRVDDVLRRLKRREGVVFKSADKDRAVVILSREDYETEALRILGDSSTYERIQHSREPSTYMVMAQLKGILEHDGLLYRKRDIGLYSKLAKFLLELHPDCGGEPTLPLGKFYLRMKVHKPGGKGRPIVCSRGTVTYNTSVYLDSIFKQVARTGPSFVRDSGDVVLHMEDMVFPETCIFLYFDVESLYPSIRIEDALLALKWKLAQSVYTDREVQRYLDLTEWVLNNNYIEFGYTTWRQVTGLAMGTPVAPSIANIFLEYLESMIENKAMEMFGNYEGPLYFKRFLDDGAAIFRSTQAAERFGQVYGSIFANINITTVISDTSMIFLDVEVYKGQRFQESGRLDVRLYQKPSNKYLYLPKTSFHAPGVFRSIVVGETYRCKTRCTDDKEFQEKKSEFIERFSRRGHNQKWTAALIRRSGSVDREELIQKLRGRKVSVKPLELETLGNRGVKMGPLVFKTVLTPRHRGLNLRGCLEVTEDAKFDPDFRAIFGDFGIPRLCYRRPKNVKDFISRSRHVIRDSWLDPWMDVEGNPLATWAPLHIYQQGGLVQGRVPGAG